jgi:transcriptional regulator with GAF, ATPase, and Fis domain
MESTNDSRFDPHSAVQLLLDVAHERSWEGLLHRLVNSAVERPDIACIQIWLIDKGDICRTCALQAECRDRSRCLHLVAGKGISIQEPGQAPAFDDPNARMPLGFGELGQLVVEGRQSFVRSLDDENGMVGFDWLRREGIRGSGITPIIFKEEVLGATIAFTRQNLPDELRPWSRIFADHLGAAISNVRAFAEIQRLKSQLEQQNTYLEEEVVQAKAFGDLVGASAALRQIVSQIELVAPTEASVLILGETGTGKELVAREIHRRSQRSSGPLIRVNCASIPRDLFESEFFGHVKGAFTGAIKDRAGRFETADGGTIFLDEIGEIPLEMQAKLLRVLQDKVYERVGEDRTRSVNVRIIGATNRDLKKAIAAGRFREDLYYRLHVFPMQVPPLRERKEDIPLLAAHFLDLSVRELKCAKPRLTRAAITRLQGYDWPGNVRELRNVIERAVILARGGALDFDLPVTASSAVTTRVISTPGSKTGSEPDPAFLTETELRQRERDNLLIVLQKANWKIKGPEGAAELLGIKPPTLISRMNKWGLKRPEPQE